MIASVSRDHKFQTELNYLNWFKTYCIINDLTLPGWFVVVWRTPMHDHTHTHTYMQKIHVKKLQMVNTMETCLACVYVCAYMGVS